MRRTLTVLVACALLAAPIPGPATATATDNHPGTSHPTSDHTTSPKNTAPKKASTVKLRLRTAIARLPVAQEQPKGYDRNLFRHWIDADGDCQDTRDEVLAAESKVRVTGCDITTGRWLSYYDRETWTQASDVDIDHMVPLKEAWDSGARAWAAETRERFANDLDDPRSLVAVTDNVNQSKSDRDPAEWLPAYGVCRYVKEWTAVKIRWRLRVDRAEKAALTRQARACANVRITVRRAQIG